MSAAACRWSPPPVASLPVRGRRERLPINRIFRVERAFHFTKSPQTWVASGSTVPYPPETKDYPCEMELVLVVGRPWYLGKDIEPEGVGAVTIGDELLGRVEGVGSVALSVGPAEAG